MTAYHILILFSLRFVQTAHVNVNTVTRCTLGKVELGYKIYALILTALYMTQNYSKYSHHISPSITLKQAQRDQASGMLSPPSRIQVYSGMQYCIKDVQHRKEICNSNDSGINGK